MDKTTTITISNPSSILGSGTHNGNNRNKPVLCIDTGEVFVSVTDAAEHNNVNPVSMSCCLSGKTRTCNGKRFSFVSKANENLNTIAEQLRSNSTRLAELERKAALYDAMQAEAEAERKAKAERDAIVAKKISTLARRKCIIERMDEKYQLAVRRYMETEKELHDLGLSDEDIARELEKGDEE